MKKILFLLLAAGAMLSTPANAQSTDSKGNFIVGTVHDTAFGNATKHQISTAGFDGTTVSYWLDQINDSCAGYVSVWGSIDGTTYGPYPGADSVAITVGVDVKKLWFLNTHLAKSPVRFIDIRTRLTTSYSVGKAKVTTKLYSY